MAISTQQSRGRYHRDFPQRELSADADVLAIEALAVRTTPAPTDSPSTTPSTASASSITSPATRASSAGSTWAPGGRGIVAEQGGDQSFSAVADLLEGRR